MRNTYLSLKVAPIIAFSLIVIMTITSCGLYYQHHMDEVPGLADDETRAKRIIDGDTFITQDGVDVRLIGINAPEKGSYYYYESSMMLESLIESKELLLKQDIEPFDQYGRLLAYVYVDDLFVNLEMVKRGFANVYTNPPNVEYVNEFLEAERYSRENEIGLWERSGVEKISIDIEYDADGDDRKNLNGEYVVIQNNSDIDLDISGWTVKDSGRNEYRFGKAILPKYESLYLFTGEGSDNLNRYYWDNHTPVWNNDHDTLYLRDTEGLLVGIYNY